MPAYHQALLKEMTRFVPQSRLIRSIYFGGGTPSVFPAERLAAILAYLKQHFAAAADAEITVEVNPGTVGIEDLILLRNAGFNRLSIGLQAVQNRILAAIGRIHTWEQFLEVYELSRECGFANVGVDLIAGLPEQTLDDWAESLRRVIALQPEHLSVYALQLEEGTPLEALVRRGKLQLPADDDVARMLLEAMNSLRQHGFDHYEVANYARPGFFSRHNFGYWTGRDYLGFGAGASSTCYGERWTNVKEPERYIALLEAGSSVIGEREILDDAQRQTEAVMLGLRLRAGLDLQAFNAFFHQDLLAKAGAAIERLAEAGLLVCDQNRLALTDAGVLVSNQVLADILRYL